VWETEADQDALLGDLGKRFEVVNVGPKGYPSCRYTHPSIDAALAVMADFKPVVAEIEQIRVSIGSRDYGMVFGGATGISTRQNPQSIVDAQFSIPYTVATAILRGRVFFDDFTLTAIRQPDVLQLAGKVVPVVRTEFDSWPYDVKPSEVEVVMRGGARHARQIDYARGNPRNP